MTRDRGYPDWLVLSARLLRSGYHSAGCVWLVAMCSLLLYVVIFVTLRCQTAEGPPVTMIEYDGLKLKRRYRKKFNSYRNFVNTVR